MSNPVTLSEIGSYGAVSNARALVKQSGQGYEKLGRSGVRRLIDSWQDVEEKDASTTKCQETAGVGVEPTPG